MCRNRICSTLKESTSRSCAKSVSNPPPVPHTHPCERAHTYSHSQWNVGAITFTSSPFNGLCDHTIYKYSFSFVDTLCTQSDHMVAPFLLSINAISFFLIRDYERYLWYEASFQVAPLLAAKCDKGIVDDFSRKWYSSKCENYLLERPTL